MVVSQEKAACMGVFKPIYATISYSELFTSTAALKFVNAVTQLPLQLSLSLLQT